MESQILTLCMGIGGWVGVLLSASAFLVNNEPLTFSSVAVYISIPFAAAGGMTMVVQGTRVMLVGISTVATAMLDCGVIMVFLQYLIAAIAGGILATVIYRISTLDLMDQAALRAERVPEEAWATHDASAYVAGKDFHEGDYDNSHESTSEEDEIEEDNSQENDEDIPQEGNSQDDSQDDDSKGDDSQCDDSQASDSEDCEQDIPQKGCCRC